jgi:predicted cupin superfamily sugar epimerase/mannose-6-phosphate isomerase-like protein (cupin superfamily)
MKFSFKPAVIAALTMLLGPSRSAAEPVGPARKLIDRLQMEKIPVEGAWFKVTYTSADRLAAESLPARYGSARPAGGAIYALVTREDFSAMHRLKTDEIWHYYAGDPMEILLLQPGGQSRVVVLGTDFAGGQQPQFAVPAGVWMGARPVRATSGAYTFFGTTMAPGFDYTDFEPGYRDELQRAYPARSDLIGQLTRSELASRPPAPAVTALSPPAAALPPVFSPEEVPSITVAPGVTLRELIGRVGHARTDRVSVARFALAPGKGTGLSYNQAGEEYFLIIAGRGTVVVAGESSTVQAGLVVALAPGMRHSLTAANDSALEFYAVTAPAFSPDDYVPVPAGK